ncbi:MAG: hypothetical protein IJW24_00720 [Clostridia bacterium]|nr:hypothetical protein [Clostridia bacterium]
MELDYGKIEVIEDLLFSSDDIDMIDLVKTYLKQSKKATEEQIETLDLECVDDETGYIMSIQGERDIEFLGFSDEFVTTYDGPTGDTATLDPIWINIVAKELNKINGFKANQYLFGVYKLVDDMAAGADGAKVSSDQASAMKEKLFAIEAGCFTPDHQIMTEAEKIAFMCQNGD